MGVRFPAWTTNARGIALISSSTISFGRLRDHRLRGSSASRTRPSQARSRAAPPEPSNDRRIPRRVPFAIGCALVALVRSGWRDAIEDGLGAFYMGESVMAVILFLFMIRGVVSSVNILALIVNLGIALWNGAHRVVRRTRDSASGAGAKPRVRRGSDIQAQ